MPSATWPAELSTAWRVSCKSVFNRPTQPQLQTGATQSESPRFFCRATHSNRYDDLADLLVRFEVAMGVDNFGQ